jgi:hypothetical protein
MAYFDTFTELQDTIADWLNRDDLAAKVPQFIRLLEARANRELRTHDMVKRATAVVDHGYFVVPVDWRETIALLRTSQSIAPLEFVSIENSFARRAELRSGPPVFYTQMDGKFFLYPEPTGDVELELVYRASIPSLTSDATSNWLLEKSPDFYLFGSLAEAEPYLKNDERVTLWQAKADRILASMQGEAERASYPQGSLASKRKTFG